MMKPSGALELTWTNKHLALLSLEGGGYEWVEQSDHRVSEVRLLRDAAMVGEAHEDRFRPGDNLLIRGDALNALTSLIKLPEFANEYRGRVKLVYIDPPFNTGQAFTQFEDNLEHSVWLTMMRDRLVQIREMLAPGGTVWVHLDTRESHRARALLDEVFGWDGFVGEVIWESSDSPRMDADTFYLRHNTIFVYANDGATPDIARTPVTPDDLPDHYNRLDEEGRPYYLKPLRAMGGQGDSRKARPNLYYPLVSPDGTSVYPVRPDGSDGAWRWAADTAERDAWRIEWIKGRSGWNPYYRVYADHEGTPPSTLWKHTEVGSTRTAKAESKAISGGAPFDTPKPEELMRRILEIGTKPGDIVLDCFVGSGTTAAVAHKLKRRWVAVEWSEETLTAFTIPRLTKVVKGKDQGGITEHEVRAAHPNLPASLREGDGRQAATVVKKYFEEGLLADLEEATVKKVQKLLRASDRTKVSTDVLWMGGGGFRILDVAPSMFVEEAGVIYLADWASDDALAEPVAAQLGYTFLSDPPFSGRKGRIRLAVVDGIVSSGVVEILVRNLEEDQSVVICGTAVAPDARAYLRLLSKASRIRKIPASILAEYRLAYRQRRTTELHLEDNTPNGDRVETESETDSPDV